MVASLYLFLCTLGALTHVHTLIGVEAEEGHFTTLTAQNASPHASNDATPQVQKGTVSTSTHCAYCEWQAGSVSAALAPQRLTPPQVSAYEAPPFLVTLSSRTLPRSSSRAPPVA